jgi:hypothetical protein
MVHNSPPRHHLPCNGNRTDLDRIWRVHSPLFVSGSGICDGGMQVSIKMLVMLLRLNATYAKDLDLILSVRIKV